MTRTSISPMNCSFARAADRVGDKWSLVIIRDAFYGVQTFSAFRRRLGIAPTVLADRLDGLCENGILARSQVKEGVDRHRYVLTDAGRALFPIVVGLMQWGDEWVSGEGNEPVALLDRANLVPIQKLQVRGQDGAPLSPSKITFAAGPGADDATKAEFELTRRRGSDAHPGS
jgi:DNA-binding HxlR family transcriptional regulator